MKNAIVVMFDSLQYNYLHCYGNEWIKTPNFDRFAREGVLFENYYTEGLPTIPCRRAMHTGRFTLPRSGWSPLTMEDTTIADLCWGRPIDTALIFDCPMYRQPKFGYTRGFDKVWFTHGHESDTEFYQGDALYHFDIKNFYVEHAVDQANKHPDKVFFSMEELESYLKQMQYWGDDNGHWVAKTMKQAVQYLQQVDRNKSFFLWIDSFDPHEPWCPPSTYMDFPCPYDTEWKGPEDILPVLGLVDGVYTERELNHIRALYAETVTMCDKWFGFLLDAVRLLGLEENTLILQVSDHGEPLGNGEHGHGLMRKVRPWPYEELVHAPFMMRGPGLPAGKRVKAFIQSADVAPTVCDWLGIGVHPDMEGKSLLPLAKGEVDKVRDFAIAGYYRYSASIITHEWSYIHWMKNNDNTVGYVADFFNSEIEKASKGMGTNTNLSPSDALNEAFEKYRADATLDGEAQWTCSPGAVADVPESDELYDRKKDPLQLKNVIKEHPKEAAELLRTLRTYMSELQAS